MTKQILLYDALYDYTVQRFINELEAAKGSDISVRVFSPGGDPYSTYGALAAFNDFGGTKGVKVDGYANSCAAYFCCIAAASGNTVECLDVSTFLFHRASAGTWIENNKERFTDAIKEELNTVNANLRAMLESVTTAERFKKITGVALDDMFSLEDRIDVTINSVQAQKLGLVKTINKITPAKKKEIQALAYKVAALHNTNLNLNNNNMEPTTTLAELKSQNPGLYNEAREEGVRAERDRVSAAMVYADVDLKAVNDLIKSGETPTATFFAEMSRKQFSASTMKGMAAGNKTVETEEAHEENKGDNAAAEAARAQESQRRIEAFKKRQGVK